jgi:hypothetical protein
MIKDPAERLFCLQGPLGMENTRQQMRGGIIFLGPWETSLIVARECRSETNMGISSRWLACYSAMKWVFGVNLAYFGGSEEKKLRIFYFFKFFAFELLQMKA